MRRPVLLAAMTIAQALAAGTLALVCASAFWSVAPLALGLRSDVIMSGSMAPGIRAGDVVVSSPASVSDLRPGVVILFVDPARPHRTLLHRYITRDADGNMITKGDANGEPDSTSVPPNLLYGQGRVRIPFAGLPAYWMATGRPGHLTGSVLMLLAFIVIATSRPPTPSTAAAPPGTGALAADLRHRPRRWQARHRAVRRSRTVARVEDSAVMGRPGPPPERHAGGRRAHRSGGRRRARRHHAPADNRHDSSTRRPATYPPAGRHLAPTSTPSTPLPAPRRVDASHQRPVGSQDRL